MKVTNIIDDFIKSGNRGLIELAHGDEKNNADLDFDILKLRIEKNSNFNNKILIVFIVLLILVFILLFILIFINYKDLPIVLSLLGGQGVTVGFLLNKVHKVYKEKIFSEQLLYALPKMKTENEKIEYMRILSDFLK